jgi:hypothetical protein
MRRPARDKAPNRGPVSNVVSIPAPVGGWNARDGFTEMDAIDAVTLTNWFPATTECILRSGHTEHATGLPSQVETILCYSGGTTDKMFAISNGSVYETTSAGAVGAAVVSGLTNSRWQDTNISTTGGNFLYMANGVDTPYVYDGTTWVSVTGASTPAITGVTTTTLDCPMLHKNRLWFIQTGTLKAWYLGTLAVGGAASSFDLSAFATLGGYLVALGTWTIDAGTGVDDYWVAVTSKGQVLVYQGTDPASANTWALKGVWDLGSPVGKRCLYKYSGDLLIISQDGVLPLSSALQSSRVNPKVALTDKIQYAVSRAVSDYGSTFGWDLVYFAKENQLLLNVPVAAGSQQQYVMNTITGAWCNYTGWDANCWALFQDDLYFGGDGVVSKAWDGNDDNGADINATGLQAFNNFKSPGILKRYTMSRPVFRASGTPSINSSINVDFNTDDNTSPLTFAALTYGVWDTSLWDTGIWSGDLQVIQQWQGASGIGYYAAPQVKVAASGLDIRWVSTDIVMEKGGIL